MHDIRRKKHYKEYMKDLKEKEIKTCNMNYIAVFMSICAFIYFITGLDKMVILLDIMIVPIITYVIDFLMEDTFISKFLLSAVLATLVNAVWTIHKLTLRTIKNCKKAKEYVIDSINEFVENLPLTDEELNVNEVKTYKDYIKLLKEIFEFTCEGWSLIELPARVTDDIKNDIYTKYDLDKYDKIVVDYHLSELITGGIE